MKIKRLIFLLVLLLPGIAHAAAENGYQAILDLNQYELKEQSIIKGEEFIQANQENKEEDLDYRQIEIRNEFHESIKIILESPEGTAIKELYLNAYESLNKIAVPIDMDFKVHVINVYGQELGILRGSNLNNNKISISPFLLVKKYNFKQAKIKAMEDQKAELILKQEPRKPELQAQKLQAAKLQEQQIETESIDRSIKVANISSEKVHINIFESGKKSIGAGWTIKNDIYEAQFLEYKQEPIKISADAELILEVDRKEKQRKRAGDLALDPRGNYVWFISDPL
jgi:hypothetical protein